jgi:hypothetical protein
MPAVAVALAGGPVISAGDRRPGGDLVRTGRDFGAAGPLFRPYFPGFPVPRPPVRRIPVTSSFVRVRWFISSQEVIRARVSVVLFVNRRGHGRYFTP